MRHPGNAALRKSGPEATRPIGPTDLAEILGLKEKGGWGREIGRNVMQTIPVTRT
jgi:hypothetical protein